MDPAFLMHGEFNTFSIGCYLGIDPRNTPENKAHRHQQGLNLLEYVGIIPRRDTPANCPDCGAPLRTTTDAARHGWRYDCVNHLRRKRFCPLENTFLAKTRLKGEMSADKIFRLIVMWLKRYPLKDTQKTLSVSADTAVYWYGFCRDVACAIAWHDFIPIGGAGDVVEVDETHLFKRKYDVGRVNEWRHVWVLGGISRTTKKRFALIVDRRDADTLIPILQQCIDEDSYVCTDHWLAYGECNLIFAGHGRVNHSQNFIYPPRGEEPLWMPAGRFNQEALDRQWNGPPPQPGQQPFRIHTQNIERAWKDLKCHLRTSNNREFASQYIGEWMYRKNILAEHGDDDRAAFQRFAEDIRRAYPGIGKKPMKNRYEDIMDCDCHECQP